MGSVSSSQSRVSSADLTLKRENTSSNSSPSTQTQDTSNNSIDSFPAQTLSEGPQIVKGNNNHSNDSEKRDITPTDIGDFKEKKKEGQAGNIDKQNAALNLENVVKNKKSTLDPIRENQHETLFAKDQYIVKLEKELQESRREIMSVRQKLKRRIKALTKQLHEARQEASISTMELKAVISQKNETIENLKSAKDGLSNSTCGAKSEEESSHSKVIVELSNQLSEQADHIAVLEAELLDKKQTITELEEQIMKKAMPVDSSHISTDRLPSGRGQRMHRISVAGFPEAMKIHRTSEPSSQVIEKKPPTFERQSTALSDSDSDWELDSLPSKVHSAPAGARVKSALSVASSLTKVDSDNLDLQGNDDLIFNATTNFKDNDIDDSNVGRRPKLQKNSALKNHLERKKKTSQTHSLIGPSVAFATTKTKDMPSDTSCEPTPRCIDRSHLPGFPSLHIVDTLSH